MTERYRPTSGTEGAGFFERWCCRCARDKSMSEGKNFDDCTEDEVCPIIANTFAYDVDDPKYPVEWIVDADGPRCTAFVHMDVGIPPPRCPRTIDMFDNMTDRERGQGNDRDGGGAGGTTGGA